MQSHDIIEKLAPFLDSDYKWPEIPSGWRLEFIVYPDGEVDMDLLHPVSGVFWSEENGFVPMPIMKTGKTISLDDLRNAGVQVMSTFGHAKICNSAQDVHLKLIP